MPPISAAPGAPEPVLFLVADTGGGHRSAARAVAWALDRACPGRFVPIMLDPIGGPGSSWLLGQITRLYGPVVRHAPWLWGAVYRASDSSLVMRVLRRTLLRSADRRVAGVAAATTPAALVAFHPLTTQAAIRAGRHGLPSAPVVTVVTDLVSVHSAWRDGRADHMLVPSAQAAVRGRLGRAVQGRCTVTGLPVAADFATGPASPCERLAIRRALGAGGNGFLVVITGGGEGSGGIARQVRALLGQFGDIQVAAICGRNRGLRRTLARLATRSAGRLTVRGFADDMADWLRCADVVVTKAGPSTIAEAACCGTPLLITSHLPGQENGNTELTVRAGAGLSVPRIADLLREMGRLRADPARLDAMRAASASLARPRAADEAAALIARLAGTSWVAHTAPSSALRPITAATTADSAHDPGTPPRSG